MIVIMDGKHPEYVFLSYILGTDAFLNKRTLDDFLRLSEKKRKDILPPEEAVRLTEVLTRISALGLEKVITSLYGSRFGLDDKRIFLVKLVNESLEVMDEVRMPKENEFLFLIGNPGELLKMYRNNETYRRILESAPSEGKKVTYVYIIGEETLEDPNSIDLIINQVDKFNANLLLAIYIEDPNKSELLKNIRKELLNEKLFESEESLANKLLSLVNSYISKYEIKVDRKGILDFIKSNLRDYLSMYYHEEISRRVYEYIMMLFARGVYEKLHKWLEEKMPRTKNSRSQIVEEKRRRFERAVIVISPTNEFIWKFNSYILRQEVLGEYWK